MPLSDRTTEEKTGHEERELGGKTCSKWPQTGIKPTTRAEDSQPQYMGRTVYQLRYQATANNIFVMTT